GLLARGHSPAFPDFAALYHRQLSKSCDGKPPHRFSALATRAANLFGGGHLDTELNLAREDAGALVAINDAKSRQHIGPRCDEAHIVTQEVATGLRRLQDVEGTLGQAQLDAPVGRVSAIKLARIADDRPVINRLLAVIGVE